MTAGTSRLLTGWGRTAPSRARVSNPASVSAVGAAIREQPPRGLIARGMGRSYGDAAQNAGGSVLEMTDLQQSWLDVDTGRLVAQAGTSIDAILRDAVPRGWFIPVTAGTRFVSIGGAIGADIHGKNHHRDGSFSAAVESLDLIDATGQVTTLAPDDPATAEAFWASVGGMGRTGVISSATLAMRPIETSRIRVDTDRFTSLDALMARMLAADADYPYTVAWVDSVSGRGDFRSVLTCGDHATLDDLPADRRDDPLGYDPRLRLAAPPWFPAGALNRWTVAAFNEAWFRKAPRHARDDLHSIASFFHPLDGVSGWNRVYGRPGFVQYQFVVPDAAADVVAVALDRLRAAGAPSFLTVLKRFGPGNQAPLSFPMAGWTLALDLPAGVPDLARVLDELDTEVIAAGGRLYLAKDSRMSPHTFAAGYPRLPEWLTTVNRLDPDGVFASDLFRRLLP